MRRRRFMFLRQQWRFLKTLWLTRKPRRFGYGR